MPNQPPFPDSPRRTAANGETRVVESRSRSTPPASSPAGASTINVGDIYYALFRHKRKIIVCTLLGLVAAGVAFLLRTPIYASYAKLFIRYVVSSEGRAVRTGTDDTVTKSPDHAGETIMSSEQEILGSLDLARKVAEAVGPEKILAKVGGGNGLPQATVIIHRGLAINIPWGSSVINVTFEHPDPEVVPQVLREVVDQYLKMHNEVHRSAGMVGDFLTQETDQLRGRLAQTEELLRKARNKAGVISVEDAKRAYATQLATIRQQIFAAQADQAARQSVLQDLSKPVAAPVPTANPDDSADAATPKETAIPPPPVSAPKEISPAVMEEYRNLLARFDLSRKREQEMLAVYTPENARVKEVRAQLEEIGTRKQKLEEENSGLVRSATPLAVAPNSSAAPPASSRGRVYDSEFEAAQLKSIDAKIKALTAQMEILRGEAAELDQAEGNISELLRKKELEETNYRRYAASLEQSRINEALGSGKVSNISVIQTPSPAYPVQTNSKIVGILAVAGLVLGLAWAFLIELVLDRSVRRTADVEKFLKMPLFLSIPNVVKPPPRRPFKRIFKRKKNQAKVPADGASIVLANDQEGSPTLVVAAPSPVESDLAPFHETLRDRLIASFESRGLTHKPKLVAVSGLGRSSGITTIAAGLARSLSETGEDNVLLVDMTAGQGSAQQFVKGKLVCGLDELLAARSSAHVHENLYVVSENDNSTRLARNLPQRFARLIPQLKASDFDYIIFDMPAISQISITPRLATFMDIVLLVMESEKTDREMVRRATALLNESNTFVGGVLNKTRNYVPPRLHQEHLDTV